jgi:hypothetical protein
MATFAAAAFGALVGGLAQFGISSFFARRQRRSAYWSAISRLRADFTRLEHRLEARPLNLDRLEASLRSIVDDFGPVRAHRQRYESKRLRHAEDALYRGWIHDAEVATIELIDSPEQRGSDVDALRALVARLKALCNAIRADRLVLAIAGEWSARTREIVARVVGERVLTVSFLEGLDPPT